MLDEEEETKVKIVENHIQNTEISLQATLLLINTFQLLDRTVGEKIMKNHNKFELINQFKVLNTEISLYYIALLNS